MPPLSAVVIDYSSLIPVLIAAIQEQQKMIEELKKKVD
jgi:hypothetical protein